MATPDTSTKSAPNPSEMFFTAFGHSVSLIESVCGEDCDAEQFEPICASSCKFVPICANLWLRVRPVTEGPGGTMSLLSDGRWCGIANISSAGRMHRSRVFIVDLRCGHSRRVYRGHMSFQYKSSSEKETAPSYAAAGRGEGSRRSEIRGEDAGDGRPKIDPRLAKCQQQIQTNAKITLGSFKR